MSWYVRKSCKVLALPGQWRKWKPRQCLGRRMLQIPHVHFSFPIPKNTPIFLNTSQGLVWEMSQDGQIFAENSDPSWFTRRATKGSSCWRQELWGSLEFSWKRYVGRDPSSYGVHSQFSWWAQKGTDWHNSRGTGENRSCSRHSFYPFGCRSPEFQQCTGSGERNVRKKIISVVQTFYKFNVLIVHDWRKV